MRSLGPYTLAGPLGTGGMCDVWQAVDSTGRPAAVKVLRAQFDREVLRDEVNLMAQLDHPNIVQIFGSGDATDDEARALKIEPGTPWVAMELGTGHFEPTQVRDWQELRHFALSVLEALMHSHARAVIHRDIKPGNVLVMDGTPRFALSDFGIAFPKSRHRSGTLDVPMRAAGTLVYISPEQLLGRWRDFGPYTDLFSFGVMLFETVVGRLPFAGSSRVAIGIAHSDGPPPLGDDLRFEVPEGFEAWLRMMLAYDPSERFAFAADAAHLLLAMESPRGALRAPSLHVSHDHPTIPDWAAAETTLSEDSKPSSMFATLHVGGPLPPMPLDWRPKSHRHDSTAGRQAERDALWTQLSEVTRTGTSQAVVLRGVEGAGASHLARWLCERAREVGAADFVTAKRRHGRSALSETLQHVFELHGLKSRARQDRLRDIFRTSANVDIELLEQLAVGRALALGDEVFAVEQALTHFSSHRPLIAWLDDADMELELLEIAALLTPMPNPILFVLTITDTAAPQLPFEAARVRDLLARPAITELPLAPLPTDAVFAMLERRGVAPEHRAAIIAASHGNPLLVGLVSDALAAGEESIDAPIHELWRGRAERLLSTDERAALVAAAVLGEAVHVGRWRALCESLDIAFHDTLPTRFIGAGFWTIDHRGYAVRHPSLRAALVEPREASDLRRVHRAAADLFDPREFPGTVIRAQHLARAGDLRDAAVLLTTAIILLSGEGRDAQAESLIGWWGHELAHTGPSDPLRLRLELMQLIHAARLTPTLEVAEGAAAVARSAIAAKDPATAAHALRVQSFVEATNGNAEQAMKTAQNAVVLAAHSDEPFLEADIMRRIGWTAFSLGRPKEAEAAFESAIHTGSALAQCASVVGCAHARLGQLNIVGAREAAEDAMQRSRAIGARVQQGHAFNVRAEVKSAVGEFDGARQDFAEAARLLARADPTGAEAARMNLAALVVAHDDPAEGRELVHAIMARTTSPRLQGMGELLLVITAARCGDSEAWDARQDLGANFMGTEFCSLWECAGDAWAARNDARAVEAFELALAALEGTSADETNPIRARLKLKLQACR